MKAGTVFSFAIFIGSAVWLGMHWTHDPVDEFLKDHRRSSMLLSYIQAPFDTDYVFVPTELASAPTDVKGNSPARDYLRYRLELEKWIRRVSESEHTIQELSALEFQQFADDLRIAINYFVSAIQGGYEPAVVEATAFLMLLEQVAGIDLNNPMPEIETLLDILNSDLPAEDADQFLQLRSSFCKILEETLPEFIAQNEHCCTEFNRLVDEGYWPARMVLLGAHWQIENEGDSTKRFSASVARLDESDDKLIAYCHELSRKGDAGAAALAISLSRLFVSESDRKRLENGQAAKNEHVVEVIDNAVRKNHPKAFLEAGQYFKDLGKFEKALEFLDQGIELGEPLCMNIAGNIRLDEDLPGDSAQHYWKAIELYERSFETSGSKNVWAIGKAYFQLQEIDRLREFCNSSRLRNHPAGLKTLAMHCYYSGDEPLGREIMEIAYDSAATNNDLETGKIARDWLHDTDPKVIEYRQQQYADRQREEADFQRRMRESEESQRALDEWEYRQWRRGQNR